MSSPNEPKSMKDKLAERLKNFRENEKLEGFYHYANTNTHDMINYILLILGLILLYFFSTWGGLLIGGVAGLHFYERIAFSIKNLNEIIATQRLVSSLIVAGVLLALFIADRKSVV